MKFQILALLVVLLNSAKLHHKHKMMSPACWSVAILTSGEAAVSSVM